MASRIERLAAVPALWLLAGGTAHAQDFVQQELTMKIVSLVVGVVVIFALCLLLVYQLLWRVLKVEYDMATKLSIVLGVILSYLWFLYNFGQVFNFMMIAALGLLIVVILVLLLLRRE